MILPGHIISRKLYNSVPYWFSFFLGQSSPRLLEEQETWAFLPNLWYTIFVSWTTVFFFFSSFQVSLYSWILSHPVKILELCFSQFSYLEEKEKTDIYHALMIIIMLDLSYVFLFKTIITISEGTVLLIFLMRKLKPRVANQS